MTQVDRRCQCSALPEGQCLNDMTQEDLLCDHCRPTLRGGVRVRCAQFSVDGVTWYHVSQESIKLDVNVQRWWQSLTPARKRPSA